MAIQPTYPGVYVQEELSGVRTITGVSTSVAAFIGMVNRGPLGQPTRVLSFADYEREFGDDTSVSQMTDQARQFFLNGGQQAFIMRIASGADEAQVTVENEFNTAVLVFTAKEAGEIGDTVRVEVDYNTSSPESTFNVRVFRHESDGSGGLTEVEEEVFSNLTMDPAGGRYAVDLITQQSALVNAELASGFTAASVAFKGYALAGRTFASDADFRTQIQAAIAAAGGTGRFRISVDGSPFVDGTVTAAQIGAVTPVTDFAARINTALLAYGASVTASLVAGPNARNYLLIQSATSSTGGSVVLRRGASNDIAEDMHFGLDDGGFEVDGFAHARPAPTGIFYRPGNLDPSDPGWLDALTGLADQDPTDLETFTLTDTAGPFSNSTAFSTGFGNPIVAGTAGIDSLGNVRDAVEAIVDSINALAQTNDDFNWAAERHGFRFVVRPLVGDANTSGTFATGGSGGTPYNMGAGGNGTDQPNVAYYSLNATAAGNYQTGAGGVNGVAPGENEYEEAFTVIDRQVDLFNLMILPRAATQTDADMESVWGMASVFCQERRAFLIVDPRSTWATADDVESEIADVRIGLATDHAAIYWPRVAVSDDGLIRYIDPSGSIAGLMARIDSTRGVWKAPAGTEATIRGVRGLEHAMSDRENGLINPQAVNALRVFPAGVVSWGARTMVGFDNSGNDDYKYLPVRRLALFLEESLYRGLQFAVFEPNDEPLWGQIRLAAGAFMNSLFRKGAFQGQKSSDAYFVKVDSETTTQNDINLGIVNVVVGFAPLKPAEFVIITIKQRAGEVSV
jgi:phage tail sheath protein FI